MKQFLLTLWIKHKLNQGCRKGWIGPVPAELDFMRGKNLSDVHSLEYKQDRTASNVPWDYQGDSVECFKRGGGDCNWIHRVWQVWDSLFYGKTNAFLVTWLHKPCKTENLWRFYTPKNWFEKLFYVILNWLGIALAHTTVIIKGEKTVFGFDYGGTFSGDSALECLNNIARHRYGVEVHCFVAQDIFWKVVKI